MAVKKKTAAKKKVALKRTTKKPAKSKKKKTLDDCTGTCVYINDEAVEGDGCSTGCHCPTLIPTVEDEIQICTCIPELGGRARARLAGPKFKKKSVTFGTSGGKKKITIVLIAK